MRAAIAAAMSRSKREIPHYYLSGAHSRWRWRSTGCARATPTDPLAERLLPAALLLRATTIALARVPELNGHWRDGAFEPLGRGGGDAGRGDLAAGRR
jgi:pyruvate dehydrogenase E2 component (dihydrolipoamide acetyltransferase)